MSKPVRQRIPPVSALPRPSSSLDPALAFAVELAELLAPLAPDAPAAPPPPMAIEVAVTGMLASVLVDCVDCQLSHGEFRFR